MLYRNGIELTAYNQLSSKKAESVAQMSTSILHVHLLKILYGMRDRLFRIQSEKLISANCSVD